MAHTRFYQKVEFFWHVCLSLWVCVLLVSGRGPMQTSFFEPGGEVFHLCMQVLCVMHG